MFISYKKIAHKLGESISQERGFTPTPKYFGVSSQSERGFSIIELIVVVTIIIIFSSILLTRLPVLSSTAQLNKAANELLQTGLSTYSDSVSVKEFRSGIYPSYGIFLDTSSPRRILVFADCVADDNSDGILNDFDLFTYRPSSTDCEGENSYVREETLNGRVYIKEIRTVSGGITKVEPSIHIVFLRPEPSIWITNATGIELPTGRMEIDISDVGNNFTETVVFWISGKIEILD